MSKKEKNKKKRSNPVKRTIQGLVTGSILTSDVVRKQFPFLITLAILGLIYIANRYHAETVFIQTEKIKIEIDELRSEKIATQSMLMRRSRRGEIVKMLREKESELIEPKEPPTKIFYNQQSKNK
ncbi:MAG: hypothetical protein GX879_02040 [Bacteroidales bacterium]|nr:hypothetical protein [Bacteroidales bacterium]